MVKKLKINSAHQLQIMVSNQVKKLGFNQVITSRKSKVIGKEHTVA